MQLFRHCYSQSEWSNGSYPFYMDIANFGFCKRDGSELTEADCSGGTPYIDLRWKLDTANKNYIKFALLGEESGYGFHQLSRSSFYYSNNSSSGFQGSGVYISYPAHIIYLPLKNNGFLTFFGMNSRSDGWYPGSLYSFSPTPKIYATSYRAYNDIMAVNIIGIPPFRDKKTWTYLYFNPPTTEKSNVYIDYGNGVMTNIPYLSGWSTTGAQEPIYQNTYTNINQNVCSLIKMPYNTTYLDGIYLLATSPYPLKECTFFSFNGRNFLNILANLVIELTPTTT